MATPDPTRRECVRKYRRELLTVGIIVPFAVGVLTFCLVVPTLALLNLIVPHLPWIPADHPVEPAVPTAWRCARLITVCTLVVWAVLFVFVPKPRTPRRSEG